jgi:hypothetical protein
MRELEAFGDDLPEMDPVIFYETTDYGWRGLTSHGEVLEVRGTNGQINVPDSLLVAFQGKPIGRRQVTCEMLVDIDKYLYHFNRVISLYKSNQLSAALTEAELTLAVAPTLRARFNHSMILLAAGRWRQGLHEYWNCEQSKPFMRPQVERAIAAGLRPWKGEPLTGKRLLVLHAHGFGDTLMMLRFVPMLKKSVMVMPPELHQLAEQCGLVVREPVDCDFFCPILHLLYMLNVTPDNVNGQSYLKVKHVPPRSGRRRIGVAWSVGKPSDGDYPREIELKELVGHLGDAEFHSVQAQGAEEAELCKVIHHQFRDFTECAELMMGMDEIVSVDTAALHLAGAIGHPNVTGLLSYWHSWRWQAKWYDNVKLCRQTSTGDWASALAQS